MAPRITRLVESVAEFLSRFWLISKSEEQVLEEQRRAYGSDSRRHHTSEDERA